MITSTTSTLQGKTIETYHGVVSGEAIMGANAVIGIDLDFETVGQGMMMCIATGTAVTYHD